MHSDWVKIFTRLALSDHCGFFWSREITLPWKLFMTFSLSQAFNLKPRKSKTMQVDSGKVGLNLASGPVTSFWSEKTAIWRPTCCWLGWALWALVTPVKATWVGVWDSNKKCFSLVLDKNFNGFLSHTNWRYLLSKSHKSVTLIYFKNFNIQFLNQLLLIDKYAIGQIEHSQRVSSWGHLFTRKAHQQIPFIGKINLCETGSLKYILDWTITTEWISQSTL